MRVDTYEFGRLVIDGTRYVNDVILLPDQIIDNWWRLEGHRLDVDDLGEVVRNHPRLLIVGCGMYGMMKVPEATTRYLKERGIDVRVLKTAEACTVYNEQSGRGGVAAAFHLTC